MWVELFSVCVCMCTHSTCAGGSTSTDVFPEQCHRYSGCLYGSRVLVAYGVDCLQCRGLNEQWRMWRVKE